MSLPQTSTQTPINSVIQTFYQQFPLVSFQKGEYVQHSGESQSALFFIQSGSIKLVTTSLDGQNLILHLFHEGACFSLLNLINDGKSLYDGVALTAVTAYKVPCEAFLDLVQHQADVSFEFQLRLLKGIQGLLLRIQTTAFVPTYNQVASILFYFYRHFKPTEHSSTQLTLQLTHQEISEWLGITRENVSIQMKKLERDGFITRKDHFIEITNVNGLQQLAARGLPSIDSL